jgi:hypothetical protein
MFLIGIKLILFISDVEKKYIAGKINVLTSARENQRI